MSKSSTSLVKFISKYFIPFFKFFNRHIVNLQCVLVSSVQQRSDLVIHMYIHIYIVFSDSFMLFVITQY